MASAVHNQIGDSTLLLNPAFRGSQNATKNPQLHRRLATKAATIAAKLEPTATALAPLAVIADGTDGVLIAVLLEPGVGVEPETDAKVVGACI